MALFPGISKLLGQNKSSTDGPPSVISLNGGHTPPIRGSAELLNLYNNSPWLRAVVGKISKAVGETDWRLFVSKDSNNKYYRNSQIQRSTFEKRRSLLKSNIDQNSVIELTDHPLLDLLACGNEKLIGHSSMQVCQTHIDLIGEGFWLLEKNSAGMPVSYWPLPPTWVKKFPTKESPYYTISANGTVQVKIPVTEFITFVDPNPADPYGRGSGIAKALGDELEIDEFAAKHQKAFFYNRARPDIIVSGENISPEDAKRLEHKWLATHQGFWKAFKPIFFSRKIDIKEMTQSMESLQMVSLRQQERDAVINVYGVPPEKLGVVGEAKRSTISAADLFWAKDVIRPRLELLRASMQAKLVPMYDEKIILDYYSPVVADDEFDLSVMKAAIHAFTINDFRKKANMPSLGTEGDVIAVPLNTELKPVTPPSNTKAAELASTIAKDVMEQLPDLQKKVYGLLESRKIK